jgi:hypothetical protein
MASARLRRPVPVLAGPAPASRPGSGRLDSLLARLARTARPEAITKGSETPETSAAEASEARGGWRGFAEKIFGIDVRSLALFRICLALIMIGDLLYRAQDLQAHYTDAGVLPIALVSLYQQQHWYWSIHTLHPALPLEVLLFIVAGLFALSLLVGYRTRTVSVVCWLLLISLQNRNTMVLTGGDTMLRVLAFWAMFLPLGLRWSVDRALDKTDAPMPQRIFSVGSMALIVQLGIVYLFGALLKTGPTWRIDHTAIYYALSIGEFATPLAKFLLHYPEMLKSLTIFAWYLELMAPFLIVFSAFSGSLRTVVVFLYVGFHISLGACLALGLFPVIGALAWVVLLPGWFWTHFFRLAARLPRPRVPAFLTALVVRATPWQSRLHPQSVSTHLPRAAQAVALFFLFYVVCWNVRMTNFPRFLPLFPVTWNWVGEIVRMDQSWELFAPDPMKTQGWMVVPAILQDGEEVDLKTQDAHVTWDPPPLISTTYYNERWRKYLMNLSDTTEQSHRLTYAAYLGNRWNNTHPAFQRVKSVRIVLVRSQTLPGSRYSDPEQVELFKGEYP